MEEAGKVRIAFVDLVPNRWKFPISKVTRDQRRLARSGRTFNPDEGARAIEAAKKLRALENLRQKWSNDLGCKNFAFHDAPN
jgi:hypothetical protein